MTDKPEPTAEHIDAGSGVRFALNDVLDVISADFQARDGEPMSEKERETVAYLLTSTDPAVHAAQAANLPTDVMLTALVERGALAPRWGVAVMSSRQVTKVDSEPAARYAVRALGGAIVRRLVTPWEPTP